MRSPRRPLIDAGVFGLAAACDEFDLVLDDDLDPNVELDGDDDV